jgi:transcriptional regulator with XRE-family HTH domain
VTCEELRALRLAARLNQTELATFLDVGRTAITAWEVGRNPIPDEIAERLATADLNAARDPERRELLKWEPIIERAAAIVEAAEVGITLRQCFYRLVSEGLIPNTLSMYQALSARTAKARRDGRMGDFLDQTRTIHRYQTFTSPDEARRWLQRIYRRDRTEGQAETLYLGVEKHGTLPQLQSWFGDLGVPIIPLGGYGSQTFKDKVQRDSEAENRPAVLIYAGDFDPSGEDILRDFTRRVGFDEVVRVALTAEQVEEWALPKMVGKVGDSRAAGFEERYGELVQVEVEALTPERLRALYQEAIDRFWDADVYAASLAQETRERARVVPSRGYDRRRAR